MKLYKVTLNSILYSMNPIDYFNKHISEIKKNFNPNLVDIRYFEGEKPAYIIIYDEIVKFEDILKIIPDDWHKLSKEKVVNLVITPHPLTIFNMYAQTLDDYYDDSLIIRYENFDKPTFDIQYDECDPVDIRKNLPSDWTTIEKYDIVKIIIRKFEEPEFLQSQEFKDLQNNFNKKLDDLLK